MSTLHTCITFFSSLTVSPSYFALVVLVFARACVSHLFVLSIVRSEIYLNEVGTTTTCMSEIHQRVDGTAS